MNEFVIHAQHNETFHDHLCEQFPASYFDWKLTAIFYAACHYLKALAVKRNKIIGEFHVQINNNIRSGPHNPTMPLPKGAYKNYMDLFHYSQTARYDGVIPDLKTFEELRKADYQHALQCFTNFKKYMVDQGVITQQITT